MFEVRAVVVHREFFFTGTGYSLANYRKYIVYVTRIKKKNRSQNYFQVTNYVIFSYNLVYYKTNTIERCSIRISNILYYTANESIYYYIFALPV